MLKETFKSLAPSDTSHPECDFEQSGLPTQNTFNSQLTLLRKSAHFSQRNLADLSGMDHSFISRLESHKIKNPSIPNAAVLVEVLKPDLTQTLNLIASLAKESDTAYINNVFNLSNQTCGRYPIYGLKSDVSKALSPTEKAKDYFSRRKRTQRQVALIGGIDHSAVSRFLNGEIILISGNLFISLVKGLGLTTREQILDFFYSFGFQKNSL